MDAMGKGVHWFAMTTDGWTSRAYHSYVAHTVHYFDGSWTPCSHLLDTAELSVEHTGVNLATELEETLQRRNLPANNLVAATTDNARNIVLAIEMLNWQHFSCIAHTLQLVVQKAMATPQVTKPLPAQDTW